MANLSLNKVILGGRIAQDLELKQTPQGVAVTSFSIAVNRKGKDAQTDFINCVAWRQTADFICRFFKKGSSICISGSVQTRTWNDQQNNKRTVTEIIADEAFFVDSKGDSGTSEQGAPTFTAAQANFEEIAQDDDLPF
ncbi:MAG: single-stranded DNA-binding protein [Oscillospiraceae bacterium]|nr:single-stranded DNA-binding protein [Oscillospiraceae bacterium]